MRGQLCPLPRDPVEGVWGWLALAGQRQAPSCLPGPAAPACLSEVCPHFLLNLISHLAPRQDRAATGVLCGSREKPVSVNTALGLSGGEPASLGGQVRASLSARPGPLVRSVIGVGHR